jgi:putative hydrolase of the HAD superfamily
MIKALLIDLFDTLVYIREEYYLRWREEMARHFHLDAGEFRDFWWKQAHDRFLGKIGSTEAMLDLAASRFMFRLSAQDRDALAARELEELLLHSRLYPYTLETLQIMKREGFLLALVSNATYNARPLLEHFGLSSLFEALIISCEVGVVKPDTAIYEMALRALDVSPQESLFVGDGACQELDGAHEAGMVTLRIVQEPQSTLFGKSMHSDFVISRLDEALHIARSLSR